MNIFLKFLPYLLIIALGAGIYGGFRYMSNELSITKEQNQTLIIKNNELQNQINSLKGMKAQVLNAQDPITEQLVEQPAKTM